MTLTDILAPSAVVAGLRVNGKKMLLQELAARAVSICSIPEREIFDALLQRERLGSTGIGNGIAIPHGKFSGLGGLVGMFARLERPIDFEALDGQLVDLVFVLLAPASAGADHLKGLARVARVLRNPAITAKLRLAREAEAIHAILMDAEAPQAA